MTGGWGGMGRIGARAPGKYQNDTDPRKPVHEMLGMVFFADFEISPQIPSMLDRSHLHIPYPSPWPITGAHS